MRPTRPTASYEKIESDGTQIRGYQSLNGTDWTVVGQPANLPTGTVRLGMFSLGNAAATTVTSEFDWFTLTTPGGPAAAAATSSTAPSLDKTRWNGIVYVRNLALQGRRRRPDADHGPVRRSPPANKNYILQTADRTSEGLGPRGEAVGRHVFNNFQQAGIVAWLDHNNYVKFERHLPQPTTRASTASENRSNVNGTIIQPQPQVDVPVGVTGHLAAPDQSGTNYQGEISYNGTTWTARRRAGHQPDGRSAASASTRPA